MRNKPTHYLTSFCLSLLLLVSVMIPNIGFGSNPLPFGFEIPVKVELGTEKVPTPGLEQTLEATATINEDVIWRKTPLFKRGDVITGYVYQDKFIGTKTKVNGEETRIYFVGNAEEKTKLTVMGWGKPTSEEETYLFRFETSKNGEVTSVPNLVNEAGELASYRVLYTYPNKTGEFNAGRSIESIILPLKTKEKDAVVIWNLAQQIEKIGPKQTDARPPAMSTRTSEVQNIFTLGEKTIIVPEDPNTEQVTLTVTKISS